MKILSNWSTRYHQDKLASLDAIEGLALQSGPDCPTRQAILEKIEKARSAEILRYNETVQPDGSIRVRHPAIGVISAKKKILDTPVLLFGNFAPSLTSYTISVSRAEAVISHDGIISYEPVDEVIRFACSEHSFNGLITNSASGAVPVNLQFLNGQNIEPSIPSVLENRQKQLHDGVSDYTTNILSRLEKLVKDLIEANDRGGKLKAKDADRFISSASAHETYSNNILYLVNKAAEHSQQVSVASRLEIESIIGLKGVDL